MHMVLVEMGYEQKGKTILCETFIEIRLTLINLPYRVT